MPVIASAQKKLRKDKKRTAHNKKWKIRVKNAIKKAKTNPSEKLVRSAISLADKAAKKNIFHKNKTARIKSSLSKLLVRKTKSAKKTK